MQTVTQFTQPTQPRTKHQRRIAEVLAGYGGAIEDPNGQAVSLLMAETGHRTTNALSGVLAQMEREHQITRDVKGRRTYRIALAAAVPAAQPDNGTGPADLSGVDLDMLAGVLLKKCLVAMQASEDVGKLRAAERRADVAQQRVTALEHDLKTVRDELAETKAFAAVVEKNYQTVVAQMDKARKNEGTPISKLISRQELRELDQLMKQLPNLRG